MKIPPWTIPAAVAIAAVSIIAALMTTGRSGMRCGESTPNAEQPKVIVIESNSSWPMFRGSQNLTGRASGTLPDLMEPIWKFKTNGEIKSSPVIEYGLVFVGSSDANIYAIDLESGEQVWSYRTGDAVEAAPCVADGSVFVGSSDNFLYAIDAKSGALEWKYETDGRILGGANWAQSPDGRSTWILVGSYDAKLHCVDSANGRPVWTYETDSYVNGSPAVADGKVIFGGCDAMIHVVNLADGGQTRQIDTGSFIAASTAVFEDRAYVGNYDGIFVCVDIAGGRVIWKYGEGDSPYFSSPALDQKVVVFGGRDKRVHCLSRTDRQQIWEFKTLGEVDSSPVICADKVVVGSEDGRLYMIRLSDGKQVWSYEIGQPITSSPAVANKMVVVGCDNGFVYAFGPKRQNRSAAL